MKKRVLCLHLCQFCSGTCHKVKGHRGKHGYENSSGHLGEALLTFSP